jgi:hypothetical protein
MIALAFFMCFEFLLSTKVMARLKAVISPFKISFISFRVFGCAFRFPFSLEIEMLLVISG